MAPQVSFSVDLNCGKYLLNYWFLMPESVIVVMVKLRFRGFVCSAIFSGFL